MFDPVKLRELATKLDSQFALLGFFDATMRNRPMFPLADLVCCCLTRSPKIRHYGEVQNKPAMLASVPAIYERQEGVVHVGGPDWHWILKQGRRQYTRTRVFDEHESLLRNGQMGKAEKTRPVGVLRDLYETGPHQNMFLSPVKSFDDKMAKFAEQLLEAGPDTDRCYSRWGDRYPTVPTFWSPVTPKSYMKIRWGDAIDAQVQHCAETGEWGIPDLRSLAAPDHGILKHAGPETVELWVPLNGISEAELLDVRAQRGEKGEPNYRVEHDHQVFTIESPTTSVEQKIQEIYGVSLCPVYRPAVQKGQDVEIRAGRAMFSPVPRKAWTIEELKKRPDYEALCYAVSLKDTIEHEGMEMLDLQYCWNPVRDPWVDLSRVSAIQRIRFSAPMNHGKYRHVGNLATRVDGCHLDMMNISLRVEMRRRALERETAKKALATSVAAPEPVKVEVGPSPDITAAVPQAVG